MLHAGGACFEFDGIIGQTPVIRDLNGRCSVTNAAEAVVFAGGKMEPLSRGGIAPPGSEAISVIARRHPEPRRGRKSVVDYVADRRQICTRGRYSGTAECLMILQQGVL